MAPFFWIRKKVHWSDTDAAGVAWFPNFLGWFEDAEEELFAALGRPRQALLDAHAFGMPRVDVQVRFRSPARAGQVIRIGIATSVENPRRLRHVFEIRDDGDGRVLAEGTVRVGSIELASFTPRDLPGEVTTMIAALPDLANRQAHGEVEVPWT